MNYVKGLFGKKDQPSEETNDAESAASEEEVEQPQQKKVKNFPPCYPLVYHSISACGKKKYLALMGLGEYIAFIIIAIANIVGLIIALVTSRIFDYIGGVALGGCYIIFYPLIAFFAQYWLTYGACSHKNSARYVLAFISYLVGIIFSLLMAIGVPSMGACGLVGALQLIAKSDSTFAMVYSFIMAAVWAFNVVYQVIIVLLLYRHFNEEGSSIGRAKDQIMAFFLKRSLTSTISGVTGGN